MLIVTIYLTKADEHYTQVHNWLEVLQTTTPHQVVEINIEHDPTLKERLGDRVPVVQVGPYILRSPFTQQELQVSLAAANDRKEHLEKVGDKSYQDRIQRGHTISGADRFSLWFSRNYMNMVCLLLFVYAGLPVLAPVLMKYEITGPAKVIYTIYSPLCHQLGFRSVFLFGEQAFYPRSLAHLEGLKTYEEITHQNEIDILEARRYLGDEQVGYKTALCQRDLAIYGSLLLFGIVFSLSKRRIKGIRWYVWVAIGMAPIAFDGFSQLASMAASILPGWVPLRESIPALRFLTGALFGFTTGWYLFPMLEETMSETFRMMTRKVDIVDQLNEPGEAQNNDSSQ